MFNQNNKMKTLLLTILLLMISGYSFAVDKSVYYGDWKGTVNNEAFSIQLSKKKLVLIISGEKIKEEIKSEYTYSNISPYPTLSFMFSDEKNAEHLYYVVIGSDTKCNKTKLIGFYEKTRIIPDSHGKVESTSEKVELVKQ